MIKKLRIRFILITMLSLIFVLSVIVAVANYISFKNVYRYADTILEMLQNNDGNFEGIDFSENNPNPLGLISNPTGDMTDETPYETRFFTVTYKEDGSIDKVNVSHITLCYEEAIEISNEVMKNKKLKGNIDTYRYLKNLDKHNIVFMDISRLKNNSMLFFKNSIIVSFTGTIIVFVMIVFISKKVASSFVKSYEKQKRFITDAGHELKTPLTIISANNELIEMEYGENSFTEAINKQVVRMNSMVRNLTELAKLDEKEKLDNLVNFSMSDAVLDVANNFKTAFEKENKTFDLNVQDNIILKGNERCIRQLLSVLLDNALKYSLTKASLSLTENNKTITLICKNDSAHIKKGDLNYFFERFFRQDDDRGVIEGSGIGLSIAQEIVMLHHGKITAYSEKDYEFTIKVLL